MTSSTMLPASAEDRRADLLSRSAGGSQGGVFASSFHDSQSRARLGTMFQQAGRAACRPADPAVSPQTLDDVRRRQSTKHGGFTQRYVLGKDVGPDGRTPRSARVQSRCATTRGKKLSRLVRKQSRAVFRGGIQQLFDEQRPAANRRSRLDYATLIKATIRCETELAAEMRPNEVC